MADAKKHLLTIKKDAAEWPESQKLLAEVKKRETEIDKVSKVLVAKLMSDQRKDFAKKYEISLLDQGLDTHVSTQGKNSTILRIEWVMISRPLVHKMINNQDFMGNLKRLGFLKVVMADGYEHSWSTKID